VELGVERVAQIIGSLFLLGLVVASLAYALGMWRASRREGRSFPWWVWAAAATAVVIGGATGAWVAGRS